MCPNENANTLAAEQVKGLLGWSPPEEALPLFVFDAGYDPVQLQQGLKGHPAQILVRLRAGRCFYADPPKPPPGKNGRPRRHEHKMECGHPSTWREPAAEHSCEDGRYGEVRVWSGLHAKTQNHPGHGSRGRGPSSAAR